MTLDLAIAECEFLVLSLAPLATLELHVSLKQQLRCSLRWSDFHMFDFHMEYASVHV